MNNPWLPGRSHLINIIVGPVYPINIEQGPRAAAPGGSVPSAYINYRFSIKNIDFPLTPPISASALLDHIMRNRPDIMGYKVRRR